MSEIVRDNSLKMEQNAIQDVQEADAIMKDMTDQLFSFDNQPKSEAIKKALKEKRKENKFTKGLGANVLRKRGILAAPKRSITYFPCSLLFRFNFPSQNFPLLLL